MRCSRISGGNLLLFFNGGKLLCEDYLKPD
nr:MAG TPA: hypothetical protein [Caudoviricetes sp.]